MKHDICYTYGAELHAFFNSYDKETKCCNIYMKTTKTVGYCNWYKNLYEKFWIYFTMHHFHMDMFLIHSS